MPLFTSDLAITRHDYIPSVLNKDIISFDLECLAEIKDIVLHLNETTVRQTAFNTYSITWLEESNVVLLDQIVKNCSVMNLILG